MVAALPPGRWMNRVKTTASVVANVSAKIARRVRAAGVLPRASPAARAPPARITAAMGTSMTGSCPASVRAAWPGPTWYQGRKSTARERSEPAAESTIGSRARQGAERGRSVADGVVRDWVCSCMAEPWGDGGITGWGGAESVGCDEAPVGVVDGPAVDDGEGRGELGQRVQVGGERVGRVGDQIGELAGRDGAEAVRIAVEVGRAEGVKAQRARHVDGVFGALDACGPGGAGGHAPHAGHRVERRDEVGPGGQVGTEGEPVVKRVDFPGALRAPGRLHLAAHIP